MAMQQSQFAGIHFYFACQLKTLKFLEIYGKRIRFQKKSCDSARSLEIGIIGKKRHFSLQLFLLPKVP